MDGYSMPRFAPLYPEGPYEYDGFTALLFDYPVERSHLERYVPAPLEVRAASMVLGFYDYGVVNGFGSYDELVTGVPVTCEGRNLLYSPYLLLDGDAPMAGGREIWGIPKKLGEVTIDAGGAVATASAARGGATLVEATLDAREPAEGHPLSRPRFESVYRKTVPAAEKGAAPVVDRLVVAETSDVQAERALTGPGTVEFGASAADPLSAFAPTGEVTGYLVEGSWTLGRTEDAVLHRYEESA
ncbi:MAG: acetoacetate decarboxylase family protein [Haloarculaceae archaeon]